MLTQRSATRRPRYLLVSSGCPACGAPDYRVLGNRHCQCACGWQWQGITTTRHTYQRRTAPLTTRQIGTACLRDPVPAETIAILITRYWPRGRRRAAFALWWRDLAPPRRLLARYKHEHVSWEATAQRYQRWLALFHDRAAWQQRVRDLVALSGKRVVFVCFESAANEADVPCHRRLLLHWLLEQP